MSSLVVKNHRPWQFALAVIALSTFLASLTWLLLDRSHWDVILDRISENQDWKQLWEVNQAMEKERQALMERVLMLERTTDVDKQTAALLQKDIMSLQETIYILKGELEFYQGVMDATRDSQGLDLHGIYIEPLSMSNTYRLKLVLTHVAKSGVVAEGSIKLSIEGLLAGEPRTYALEELSSTDPLELQYKIRSFKRLDMKLVLPEAFQAQQVLVEIKPKRKNQVMIREVFDWSVPAR